MEVTITIAVLVIICLALTLALIHKDKKSDEEQQVSVYNSMLLCILCKFVVMLNERISQEAIIGCMTNAVKVCANNDMFIITGEYPDGTKVDESQIYEEYAKGIYQDILNAENYEGDDD